MIMDTTLYGLTAQFGNADALLDATTKTHEAGYRKIDASSPSPIHGLSEACGFRPTMMPWIILCGGIIGAIGGFFMQWYSAKITYAINVGGKPYNSWPAFIPITFECAILLAAFSAVFGMLALNGLPKPYHPLFNVESFAHA